MLPMAVESKIAAKVRRWLRRASVRAANVPVFLWRGVDGRCSAQR
jgi:hypothetical protein